MTSTDDQKNFFRLGEIIMEIARKLHVELDGQNAPGITGSQFFVLRQICSRGRLTVSEVAEKLGVSLSAITALVDRLVKSGLVVRSRDGKDRRLVWLEATEKGEETMESCMEGRKKVVEKYFSRLPEEDLQKLIDVYEKILFMIKADEKMAKR